MHTIKLNAAPPVAPNHTGGVYFHALEYLRRKQSLDKAKTHLSNATTLIANRRFPSRPNVTLIGVLTEKSHPVYYSTVEKDPSLITNNATSESKEADQRSFSSKEQEEIDELTDQLAEATLNSTTDEISARTLGGRAVNGGFSSFFSRFSRVLDLTRVVREIETSVMTSVSCTACRAGNFEKIFIGIYYLRFDKGVPIGNHSFQPSDQYWSYLTIL